MANPAGSDATWKAVTDLTVNVDGVYDGTAGDVCISEMTLVVVTEESRP